jgi:murein DD-endopeptidase MepM/ murein hydrolase activator NlpD
VPFIASAVAVAFTLVAALMPALEIPGASGGPADKPPYPAPAGYLLPWAGGEIHAVTQGEETSLTHNGAAAYAFDFDLSYDTVVASRAGKVTFVREDSNVGGCSAAFSGSANYVVVDHGDGTSALYLHVAQDSVRVKPGDLVAQGEPIAISGETGLTCSGDSGGPGPHLHFQVEHTQPNRYFTQSLPVAFDEISKDDGVPQDGQSYVSGNYGRGREQRIKLTPHRVPRPFAPVATPADPTLIEAEHIDVPPVVGEDTPLPESAPTDAAPPGAATPAPSETVRPTRTPSITRQRRRPRQTPAPELAPPDTCTPTPTDTPSSTPSDTADAVGNADAIRDAHAG